MTVTDVKVVLEGMEVLVLPITTFGEHLGHIDVLGLTEKMLIQALEAILELEELEEVHHTLNQDNKLMVMNVQFKPMFVIISHKEIQKNMKVVLLETGIIHQILGATTLPAYIELLLRNHCTTFNIINH